MSHDIRTPMNAIMGMTSIAKINRNNCDKMFNCLEKIGGASELLLGLINEILDMSRIESGLLVLSKDTFNIGELLQDLIIMFQADIDSKRQVLKIHINQLEHEVVRGDMQRVKQVLMNILSNAIKYTPEKGCIKIDVTERILKDGTSDYIFIFDDNGRGMKPEFLDKIFLPFERANDMEIANIQGTGLGMAISHKIIQKMKGDIKVESKYGAGSRFTVNIPLIHNRQHIIERLDAEEKIVLVVDEDEASCCTTCCFLYNIGINSEFVCTGKDAIDKVQQHHKKGNDYFAVITDIKISDMDGLDMIFRIRTIAGDDLPIIALSAYSSESYEIEARKMKVNDFIVKPAYSSNLFQVMKKFLCKDKTKATPSPLFNSFVSSYPNKRILLVEDNELNREIAVEIIGMTGVIIETVTNGLEALEAVTHSHEGYYNLILMDVQMPVMDGHEASRRIRALPRSDTGRMPIIAMTANAFTEDITNAVNAGMNHHLSKPLDIKILMKMLDKYLK